MKTQVGIVMWPPDEEPDWLTINFALAICPVPHIFPVQAGAERRCVVVGASTPEAAQEIFDRRFPTVNRERASDGC